MTSSSKPSSSYSPWAGNQKVKIVDGSLLATAEKRSIVISSSLTLHNVFHVLNLSYNLLSVSKLTQDQKCQANFFPSQYEFQDLNSRRMTDSARQSGGLYFFEDGTELRRQSQNTCFEFAFILVKMK